MRNNRSMNLNQKGTTAYSYGFDENNQKFPFWFQDSKGRKWCYENREDMFVDRGRDKNPKDPYTRKQEYEKYMHDNRSMQLNPREIIQNRTNQLNPEHPSYYKSRGYSYQEAKQLASRA